MEHILQFGISIDDERIKSLVEQAAVKNLAEKISGEIFDNNWGRISGFKGQAREIFESVIGEYKDEIIERAAEKVADSIKRSKKYKEAVAQATEGVKNG